MKRLSVWIMGAALFTHVQAAQTQTDSADDYLSQVTSPNFGAISGGSVVHNPTTQQAVNVANLGSQSVLATKKTYQDVADDSNMFGAQLFRGAFATGSGSTFNDAYVVNKGDNIQLRMWGAYQFAATLTVDPEGNIFIPNVGPVQVAGVKNGSLQGFIEQKIRRIYRANVGVYAALEQAQPVRVFVTGFVRQPGAYGGISSDSVLSYLDRAGGVDPKRGSYIDIEIRRNGRKVQTVNLYDFLLAGKLPPFHFKEGDVVVVSPQKGTFNVAGAVSNAYQFEFDLPNLTVGKALMVAKPQPSATNVSVTRGQGKERRTEYYSLEQAYGVSLRAGDSLVVTSDRFAGTIAVRVEGAHQGNGALILPYGARLKDVMAQVKPNALANLPDVQLFRKSVAEHQKKQINAALDNLEQAALATQSVTKEEAALRQTDAALIGKFIAKARQVQPTGQVVILPDSWSQVILQQGDVVYIPEYTSVISVNGEVRTQGALTYKKGMTAGDYIAKSGGFGDNANEREILIIHQNGENVVVDSNYQVKQGDQVMVIPKVKTKRVEIARGLSQILYQIAVATKVVLNL